MTETVDTGLPLFLAILLGMLLVLAAIGIIILVVRLAIRRPDTSPPLLPTAEGHLEVVGKRVECFHCGGMNFHAQEILLNTWLLSLLRIDWLDSSATALTCESCGRLTWFAQSESESGTREFPQDEKT